MRLPRWVVLLAILPSAAARAADATELANQIDKRLAERWAEEKLRPAARAEDAEFLRRVNLDLTGKIPPVAEVRRFLADNAPDKRRVLVERLLSGPGYVAH